MKQQVSDRIQKLPVSATIQMATKARELRQKGRKIIDLSLGEPDFQTPDHIKDGGKKAMDDGFTKYPPVNGYLSLRQAICQKYKNIDGLQFDPDQIVVSTGAKQSIANVVLSLVNPGEEMVLVAPYWVSYYAIGQMADANVKAIQTGIDEEFKVSPEQLRASLSNDSKLLLLNSPSNPTGSVYSKEELDNIVEVLLDFPNLFVISDEIYEHISYSAPHYSMGNYQALHERLIIVNGCSKGFAMTGWRLGYIIAPQWIAKACTKMQGQFTSGASSISQKAAETAMLSTLEPTVKMREEFLTRRDYLEKELKSIPGVKSNVPDGAFYMFPNVSAYLGKKFNGQAIDDTNQLCMYLLEEMGLSVVTGEAFGAPGYIRLSYAASMAELEEAVRLLREGLNQLT